jgi:hypothetical protein
MQRPTRSVHLGARTAAAEQCFGRLAATKTIRIIDATFDSVDVDRILAELVAN